jgi:hypothetical protein
VVLHAFAPTGQMSAQKNMIFTTMAAAGRKNTL